VPVAIDAGALFDGEVVGMAMQKARNPTF